MDEKEVQKMARYIFETGRIIHENVLRIQSRCLRKEGKKSGYSELSMTQLHAIKATRREGEVTITRLAELLGVSAPSASTMVDRLVEKGILSRERSKKDRRKVVVRISPEATKDMARVEDAILGSFVEIVRKLGLDVSRQWYEVLKKVEVAIEKQ